MARIARLGAAAVLTIAVGAVGVRLATLPASQTARGARPVAATTPISASPPLPAATPLPRIVVDRAKVGGVPDVARPVARPANAARPPQQAAAADGGYVVRRVLDTHGPIRFGDWFWDESGVPAGPVVITVDTKAMVLSIFRGGYEIGTTAVIYGDDGMPTPLGVFPITQKDAHHVSNLYHAPMPYMQRLTNDGVSIHGSPIAANYATHGCIGVPVAFAKKLFGATRLGDRVIVTRGETLATGGRIKAA